MNPNAMGVLERNGLADEVRRDSWPYLARETRDQRGRLLATRDYKPLYESGKLAQGALVHRANLLDALYRSLPAGTVQFGVSLENISSQDADLVIGADGIRSQVRREFFGESETPLHGLPLAPADHGERRRRALLHRVPRTRPAHRPGADRREAALRLDDLQLAARRKAVARSLRGSLRNSPTQGCSGCSRRCRRRRASSPPRSKSCGWMTGCASRRRTAPCCSATRRMR